MSPSSYYVKYFEKVWSKNKAKGLAAQIRLGTEFNTGIFKGHADNLFPSCWITSPRSDDFYKFRMSTFVHGKTLRDDDPVLKPKLKPADLLGNRARPFHAIAEFMGGAGIGISYAVATAADGTIDFDAIMDKRYSGINWRMFLYKDENLVEVPGGEIFAAWGDRGRPSYARKLWDNDALKQAFAGMSAEQLDTLLHNELFYTGYMKSILKKPTNDPYDIDGFVMSMSQKYVLPIEFKEKYPVLKKKDRYFGIDAGRIMMLLRLCVPNEANAMYIVREVDENGGFVGWKYTTLSGILMRSSWNLIAGGTGMTGGDTQTVRIPYDEFEDMTGDTFADSNLRRIAGMPDDVRRIVSNYRDEQERSLAWSAYDGRSRESSS